jgi:hypothetical protein
MAVALRRPGMLRFSNSIARAVTELESSLDPADRVLAAWTKLQHIAEEAAVSLGLDDPLALVDPRDTRIQLQVVGFQNQLGTWKQVNWGQANSKYISVFRCCEHSLTRLIRLAKDTFLLCPNHPT